MLELVDATLWCLILATENKKLLQSAYTDFF